MTMRDRAALAVTAASVMAAACGGTPTAPAFDRSACAATVVLLDEPVDVLAAPRADAKVAATLKAGSAIYLCGKQTRWPAVLYPRSGERSDCTRRPEAAPCPVGWLVTVPRHTVPD
jgi:hypothetical protein